MYVGMWVWDIFPGILVSRMLTKLAVFWKKNKLAPDNSGNSLISARLSCDSYIGNAL
jgi:hypothetical protein